MAAISWVTVSWVATASSRRVESRARRVFPFRTPVASINRAHGVEDPFRAIRLSQSGAPIGENGEIEPLVVKGKPARHLPADPVPQRPGGVTVRETFEGLEHHDRCHHVKRGPKDDRDSMKTGPRICHRGRARRGGRPRKPRRCPREQAGDTETAASSSSRLGSLCPCTDQFSTIQDQIASIKRCFFQHSPSRHSVRPMRLCGCVRDRR